VTPHLLFALPAAGNADLLFGDMGNAPVVLDAELTLVGVLPALTLQAVFVPGIPLSIAATLPAMTVAMSINYDARVSRPTVSQAQARQTAAIPLRTAHVSIKQQDALPSHAAVFEEITAAQPLTATWHTDVDDAEHRVKSQTTGRLSGAVPLSSRRTAAAQDAVRMRRSTIGRAESALRLTRMVQAATQDTLRDARSLIAGQTNAAQPLFIQHRDVARLGAPVWRAFAGQWQDAMRPQPGQTPPVIPPVEPCYTPSPHLVFSQPSAVDGHLVFLCERGGPVEPPAATIIIPVRSVYMILNQSTSLVVASTGQPLEASGLQVSIDADSWAWSWSATVPGVYLSMLTTTYGDTVELLGNIAGTEFLLSVERIQRSRQFGKSTLAISGRNRAAWLASPYAQEKTTASAEARTAQQLMAAALTENGVSLGWSLDWQITDWTVPGGVWSHSGTAIDACTDVASAVGAYIQSHRTDQVLHVLPRYPAAPWAWGTLTPDIELPEDVITVEGIEYLDKPAYDSVFVAGQAGGIHAPITRVGFAGNRPAPMVSHPLITHADAARQRGVAILGDTGRQRLITLSVPVLQETGVILPGKMIRYVEQGKTHVGIARSVSVSDAFPKATQQVSIESHDF
jgi:hypothetical protein